ncbi:MAG TPA: imidazole glycerol phosphate synthase subunit HisH [Candidatus Acidoferrum sp.]|jgi:imidazole glycerol phosphate synthase glutamine amidotransferase subunit|nr:imidazole glycerol phosphate synthase subunit HisH [Candidatus Acidoferrum sp.]
MKVTLIDYGAGNVASVERALQRLGAASQRCNSPAGIAIAEALLLPGVGHYAALMRALDERALRTPLLDAIHRGVPFLGICLGLQALYESSEEAPELTGLHLLPGSVRSLPATVKLPHMGWNQLKLTRPSRLLEGVSADAYFYFAHSFAATAANGEAVALCSHGTDFAAVIEKENIFGVQFHPEKSGDAGAQLLRNFLRLAT